MTTNCKEIIGLFEHKLKIMNRLVIIGNGFDMAHGLKTSYMDFINWYWDQRVDGFVGNTRQLSEDCLCKLIIKIRWKFVVGMYFHLKTHTSRIFMATKMFRI